MHPVHTSHPISLRSILILSPIHSQVFQVTFSFRFSVWHKYTVSKRRGPRLESLSTYLLNVKFKVLHWGGSRKSTRTGIEWETTVSVLCWIS
jgi:hypothetical protein